MNSSFHEPGVGSPHKRALVNGYRWRVVAACSAFALIVVAVVGATPSVSSAVVLPAATPRAAIYTSPSPSDFSALSWTSAFKKLHTKLSHGYAFTKWKHIKWKTLYKKYAPRIARAQATNNRTGYYLTLRAYAQELRDGHVSVTDVPQVQDERVGGGFGMTITRLDNGAVVAAWVRAGGPAARAGIKRGARILKWDGKPINTALSKTSTVLGPMQPTTARKKYEQLRYLVRSRVGAARKVVFQNRAATRAHTARLLAIDDQLESLKRTDSRSVISTSGFPSKMVDYRMLKGRIGYLRINAELDLPAQVAGDHTPTLQQFRTAINSLVAKKAKGLIVDVRANSGGSDKMVADFMASFYTRRTLYEYQNYIVPSTGKFQIWKADDTTGEFSARNKGLWINPRKPRFSVPIVALVNNGCISSGEGIAMGIKNLPNGQVVGLYGTNGSFGMVGAKTAMPEGIEVGWPYGQSLDKNKVVQIDSRNGVGGVRPDVRVPMTMRNALNKAKGSDVELAYGLRVVRGMNQ